MSEGINNKKDILLLLLYSPGCNGEVNEPVIGRTRLVKMIFLLWRELRPFFKKNIELTDDDFYKFYAWNYGPFSKEVYDDIMFFELRGFIVSSFNDSEVLPEAAEEWKDWNNLAEVGHQTDDVLEYEERSFEISSTKVCFVANLYEHLSHDQKRILRMFKCKFSRTPLRAILRYVYTQYPEMTKNSRIAHTILGSSDE